MTKAGQVLKNTFIVIIAVSLAGGVFYYMFHGMVENFFLVENTQDLITESLEIPEEVIEEEYVTTAEVCNSTKNIISDKTVILRVDDVQAYAWKETTIKMITDAEALGIPLTLGVIPKNISTDKILVNFLKQHECNLELALHGWDHGVHDDGVTPEFIGLSKKEATERLTQGIQSIQEITEEPVQTWIPPQNIQSEGTSEALKELGIKIISTEGSAIWDYDATTFEYGKEELINPVEVFSACSKAFETQNTCVVMMHPQNFADGLIHDEELYKRNYVGLLERFKDAGYTFARFKDAAAE